MAPWIPKTLCAIGQGDRPNSRPHGCVGHPLFLAQLEPRPIGRHTVSCYVKRIMQETPVIAPPIHPEPFDSQQGVIFLYGAFVPWPIVLLGSASHFVDEELFHLAQLLFHLTFVDFAS